MSEFRKAKTDFPYFLTITLVGWVDLLTKDAFCEIITDSLQFCIKNKGLIVFEYVIMPSHVHMIAQSPDAELNYIIRDFKSHTAKAIIKYLMKTSIINFQTMM